MSNSNREQEQASAPEIQESETVFTRFGRRYVKTPYRKRNEPFIPQGSRGRFVSMQIPEKVIDRTLAEVQRPDDWVGAWNRSAQRFMADARREESTGHWLEAAIARRNAAMAYHSAHLITDEDPRTVRMLRAAGVKAFAQAAPRLYMETRKVSIPWRTDRLPAYLGKPVDFTGNAPVVVILNGASTIKEEVFIWAQPLTESGFAVLTVDWPGTGELADGGQLTSEIDDFTDGLFNFLIREPGIDPSAVLLGGISLGGVVAIRAAVLDRRVTASFAVTPPFDGYTWGRSLSPNVARQLVALTGQAAGISKLLEDFSLSHIIGRLRCPLMVFGAGLDQAVPPNEASRLAAAAGDLGTLIWYPDGRHGLYDRPGDWLDILTSWFAALIGYEDMSTQVDLTISSVETSGGEAVPESLEPLDLSEEEQDGDGKENTANHHDDEPVGI